MFIVDGTAINLSLDHTTLVLSLFLDFTVVNLSFYFVAFYVSVISSRVPPARAAFISFIMMVPIDSSRQELSNGCHIVIWSKFGLVCKNAAVGSDLEPLDDFLDPFLAKPIGKRCSDAVE